MKKKILGLFLSCTIFLSGGNIFAQNIYDIEISDYSFSLENDRLEGVPAFSINENIYIPVNVMSGFFGFHVEFNESEPTKINLSYGISEKANQIFVKMNNFVKDANREIILSPQKIYYDDTILDAELLNIDGYNFIELRNAAQIFDVYVDINKNEKIVNITTINDVFLSMSEQEKTLYEQYMKENICKINVEEDVIDNGLDNQDLEKYNIYMAGEHHATSKTFDLEFYLIKYFNQNQGVRYILTESGYADAQLFNKYLETGDETILDMVMNNLEGTFAYSKETRKLYEKLYEYNKTLNNDKKIIFIGIDLQHQVETGIDYLLTLFDENLEIPEVIKRDFEYLKLLKTKKYYDFNEFKLMVESIINNSDIYKQYIGGNYKHLKNGANNILQLLECNLYDGEEWDLLREEKLIENFINQYNEIGEEKCFGMFGNLHTILNYKLDQGEKYNLAGYLNEIYAKTKTKVASMTIMYYNSFYMDKYTGEHRNIAQSTINEMLANSFDGNFGFLSLNKNKSIFVEDGSIDSQQYILVIKNSDAVKRYEK